MHADLRRAVNATLMPGFAGPVLPDWLAAELADGLGSVCLFATNIVDPEQTRALCDAMHAANPAALIATDEEGGDVTRLGGALNAAVALHASQCFKHNDRTGRSRLRRRSSHGAGTVECEHIVGLADRFGVPLFFLVAFKGFWLRDARFHINNRLSKAIRVKQIAVDMRTPAQTTLFCNSLIYD